MNKYIISDLYVSAFLRARGHECRIENTGFKKFSFIFPIEAKKDAESFIFKASEFNINASKLISEVKSLKSYISNNT